MTYVVVMFVILVAVSCAGVLLRTRFEVVLPPVLFFMTLFLYAFGLVNALKSGYWMLLLLIGVSSVFAVARLRGKTLSVLAEGLSSPGMVMFCLFSLAAYFVTRGMLLAHYDEFSHWGRVVKATFLHDALGPFNPVALQFRSYPPGSSIFEYLVMRLGGRWTEGSLFWAYQLLCGAVFIPSMSNLRWRSLGRVLVVAFLAAATPLLIRNPLPTTLVDPLLGLVFGYLLALVYTSDVRDRKTSLYLALGLSWLVLLKDSGGFLAAVVLVALLIRQIGGERRAEGGARWGRALLLFALPVALMLAAVGGWNAVLRSQRVNRTLHLSGLKGLLTGDAPVYWRQVIRAYLDAFFQKPLTVAHGFGLTQFVWFVLFGLLLALLAIVYGRTKGQRPDWSAPLVVWAGAAVYAAGLLILYLVRFSRGEAVRLAAYVRYLGTYWTGAAVFLTLSLIWLVASSGVLDDRRRDSDAEGVRRAVLGLVGTWCCVLLLLAPIQDAMMSTPNAAAASILVRQPFQRIEAGVTSARIGAGDRVLVVIRDDQNGGYQGYVLGYLLLESKVDVDHRLGTQTTVDLAAADRLRMIAEWNNRLSQYDYVVLFTVAPSFRELYANSFDDPNDIGDSTVFKVVPRAADSRLIRVK